MQFPPFPGSTANTHGYRTMTAIRAIVKLVIPYPRDISLQLFSRGWALRRLSRGDQTDEFPAPRSRGLRTPMPKALEGGRSKE